MSQEPRNPSFEQEVLARMQMTFELYELAEVMKRQNLRRRHPKLAEGEIEELVSQWLRSRPGAERGDGDARFFAPRQLNI